MKRIDTASVRNKKILLRVDLDVPVKETKNGMEITDTTRLESSLPTIKNLLERNATVILLGHMGRPTGENYQERIKNKEWSLEPAAEWYCQKLQIPNHNFQKTTVGGFPGWKLAENVFVLENVRFFPEEENNDSLFAKKLAVLGDIYVNDAFAVSHRSHASIVGIPKLLPSYAGLHLVQEVTVLAKVLEKPRRPLAVVIGGAKIETKLPLISKMHQLADYVLVGGKLAEETRALLQEQHEKTSLHHGRKSKLIVATLNADKTDVTDMSLENFLQILQDCATIVWNGPLGKTGTKDTKAGTKKLAEGIVKTKAYTIVGGGDTLDILQELGFLQKFDFVSTGGGAMLSLLSGEKMPGITALQ